LASDLRSRLDRGALLADAGKLADSLDDLHIQQVKAQQPARRKSRRRLLSIESPGSVRTQDGRTLGAQMRLL
jgi:hypothetical protein